MKLNILLLFTCLLFTGSCCRKKAQTTLLVSELIPQVGDVWVYRAKATFFPPGPGYDTFFLKAKNKISINDTDYIRIVKVKDENSNIPLEIIGDFITFKNGSIFKNQNKFFSYWSDLYFTNNIHLYDIILHPNLVSDSARSKVTNFYPIKNIAGRDYYNVFEISQLSFKSLDTFNVTSLVKKDTGIIKQVAFYEISGLQHATTLELIRFIRN
jgi:hypothetical protein